MSREKVKIFMSYAREDEAIAKRISIDLKHYDLDVWYDRKSIKGGQEWKEEINTAIGNATFFLLLMSSKSLSANSFVQEELKQGLNRAENLPKSKVFIVPVRLDECQPLQEELRRLHWVNLAPGADYDKGIGEILKVVSPDVHLLRWLPIEISLEAVGSILRVHGFFDAAYNPLGLGLPHRYRPLERERERVIVDELTGLTWQQSGSDSEMGLDFAKGYLRDLREGGFAGYSDWRLPTLEEAMSLVEPKKNDADLHIDSLFDPKQHQIWTCDAVSNIGGQMASMGFLVSFKHGRYSAGGVWTVLDHFDLDYIGGASNGEFRRSIEEFYDDPIEFDHSFVRAVRCEVADVEEELQEDAAAQENREVLDNGDDVPF